MSVQKWKAVKKVPNSAVLYVRVHENVINKKGPEIGLPNEGAFYNTPKIGGTDLSSDWDKFSTPQETRDRTGREYKTGTIIFKDPSKYFIASFLVQDIVDLDLQQVIEHSPRQDNFPIEKDGYPWNRAHCSIIGDDEERRVKMRDIAKWEISPPQYNPNEDSRNFTH